MNEKIDTKFINRLLYIGGSVILSSIIIFLFKYLGILNLLKKVFMAIFPVFVAVFISFLLEPLITYLISKGLKRKYSVLVIYILLIFLFFLFMFLAISPLIEQIENFVLNVPTLLASLEEMLLKFGVDINSSEFQTMFQNSLLNLSNVTINYLKTGLKVFFDLAIAISGALFLSFDYPLFKKSLKKRIPSRIETKTNDFFKHFIPFVHKYVRGTLIDTLIIFTLSIISLTLIGTRYALVQSIFISITNLIPLIGPYIGGIPSIIIGFSLSNKIGIYSIIVLIVVQFIENNIARPLILKNTIKLHPLEGILGLTLFGSLFGIVGMIISPILMVAIKIIFRSKGELNEEDVSHNKN